MMPYTFPRGESPSATLRCSTSARNTGKPVVDVRCLAHGSCLGKQFCKSNVYHMLLMTLYCRSNESRQINIYLHIILLYVVNLMITCGCICVNFWLLESMIHQTTISDSFHPSKSVFSFLPPPLRRVSLFLAFCPTSRANARSAPIACAPQT